VFGAPPQLLEDELCDELEDDCDELLYELELLRLLEELELELDRLELELLLDELELDEL